MAFRILVLILPVLFAGCSKQIHFTHEVIDSEGNVTERTHVKYIGSPGNTNTEDITALIGTEETPLASLSVGKATVDMDKFYETYQEFTQVMLLFMEKYSTKGLVP